MEEIDASLDAVIDIAVDPEVIVRRLTARRVCAGCGRPYNVITDRPKQHDVCDQCGGEVDQREDDTEETVRNRLKVYEDSTRPLINYYEGKGLLHTVDGGQSPEQVYRDIHGILESVS
jgi:adenylate kinase